MARFIAFLILLTSIVPHAAAAQTAAVPITVEFSETAVVANGITAGGTVVFFGITREPTVTRPVAMRVFRHNEVVRDDDGDGVARLELGRPMPQQGMWAIVDMTTGRFAAVSPPGYEPGRIPLTPDLLRDETTGRSSKIEWQLSEMALLVVRPGKGAWELQATKSGTLDDNRAGPGALRVDAEALTPVDHGPVAPKHLRRCDVIVVMNPDWMEFGVMEVAK